MRQILLDTETTGLSPTQGHRITEIGCVEMIDRKITGTEFQSYTNPHRELEKISIEITGLTNEFLADKPDFVDIIDNFVEFVKDSEIIIHNAPFDLGFLRSEFTKLKRSFDDEVLSTCTVVDTLKMGRALHPGQKNSLDALCNRYQIQSFNRDKHGALLDSQILAEVYLHLTGGQCALFEKEGGETQKNKDKMSATSSNILRTPVVEPSTDETSSHDAYLDCIKESNKIKAIWQELEN